MKNKTFYLFLILSFVFCFAAGAVAEMRSDNYRIPTSVMSGGGAPMTSDSYQTDSTLGQPSPLMDPADPPYSTNYALYPGFWYTLEAAVAVCEDLSCFAATYGLISGDAGFNTVCDFDEDGDVDGSDLANFVTGFE